MSQYPEAVYSPRTKANKDGVVYAPEISTRIFAEDVQKLDDEVVGIEKGLCNIIEVVSGEDNDKVCTADDYGKIIKTDNSSSLTITLPACVAGRRIGVMHFCDYTKIICQTNDEIYAYPLGYIEGDQPTMYLENLEFGGYIEFIGLDDTVWLARIIGFGWTAQGV